MTHRAFFAFTGWLLVMCASRNAFGINVLMLTTNNGSLTATESTLKSRLEMGGLVVNTLWDGDTQANYSTAFANNDVVYVHSGVTDTDIGTKLRTCPIGVVNELIAFMDDLGFCTSAGSTTTVSSINISTNAHYITSVFPTGAFTLGSSTYAVSRVGGTTASGAVVLATVGGVNSVLAVDTGGTLANTIVSNSTASGRRAQMPIQVGVVDIATTTTNTQYFVYRMILWAATFDGELEAQWRLNETSGTSAADSSGQSRTGTVTGTATWVAAVLNNGFSFNGATKIQATGLMDSARNVSVAAWANLTTADSAGAEIISLGDHFQLRLDESGITKAQFYNGSTYVSVDLAVTFAGTGWHHFAATFDDPHNLLKLYVDGVLAASLTTTSSISYAGLGTNTVIGRHGNAGTTRDFTGTIDEVRVYSYVLTATEIAQLYGLIGRWNLNETSGTVANDATVFNRDGTLTGTANWSTDCGGMGVFDFNGSTDLFTVANAADFQPTTMLSFSAWIKGDSWGAGSSANAIFRKGDTNPNNYGFQISDGRVELLLDANDAAGIRGNTVLATGQWYHVAATWDGTTGKIYVNGQLDNSPGTAKASPIGTDTRPLYIGGRPGADYFNGMIREAQFYNRPLTSTEIAKLAGLLGHWKFAEGSGASAADSSAAASSATLSGGATWTSDCSGGNNALLTNGTGGIAQTTAAFTPPDVGTVAFWLRSTGAPAGTARIMGLGGDWEIRQQTDGTVVTDLCGDGSTNICTVTPLSEVGRWYHVAFTFDSSNDTYAIYVDGMLERSGTNPSPMSQQPAAILSFGTRTGSTEYWSGALRDVRIYSRKLCPTEIAELYGLIGHWKLDETSGAVAADASGNGNLGTFSGSPTLGVSAPHNFGTHFPSNGTLITVPASSSLNALGVNNNDFCVAFWVRPSTATGDWRPLVHKGSVNFERGPGLWLNPGNTRIHFKVSTSANNNEGTDSVANISTSGWSHIACVKAANKWRLYINGVLDTEFTLAGSTVGNSGPLYLGDDPWYGGSNVYLDDVRIYNRALCPTEVQDLHSDGFMGVKVINWVEIQ